MINVIIVDLVSNYFTGIERFSGMMKSMKNSNIRIHHLKFESYKSLPAIVIKNDCFTANCYLPPKKLMTDRHKSLYFEFLSYFLSSLTSQMENIIWHLNHLDLFELVQNIKGKLGGQFLLHIHCIPWKYTITKNPDKFKRLYSAYLNNDYDEFKKLEDSTLEYNKADKIICLSDAAKNYLEKIHSIELKKISKIYNGIEINVFQSKREEKTLLYAGRITKDKGIFDLLDAIKEVYDMGYRLKVILAGFCHIPKQTIEKKYSNINIEMPGQLEFDTLKKLYATSTIGVVPSLHEQCSYTAIEMAAFALPLIVSDVDALSEIFEDRKTALFNKLVFDQKEGLHADKKIFVNNIVELIENEELRNRISANVRNLYNNKFRLKIMYKHFIKFYESFF
jgi:glycosyltransferase involved in cell wall biosynthesis